MLQKYNSIFFQRAEIISDIRNFFIRKNIVEVETPILTKYTVTDCNLRSFYIGNKSLRNLYSRLWLITSPEYHMKRLLSRDVGPIYQICRVFRNEEIGSLHNLEFSMLEWYQPFYNMFDMMEIIEKLIKLIFQVKYCERISYRSIFMKTLSIDPFNTNTKELYCILKKQYHQHLIQKTDNMIDLLNLIFLIAIQPKLGLEKPLFIYHYPANQAMLSKINKNNFNFSDRFELFFKGIELGNGFCELIDAKEQKIRFALDNVYRKKKKYPIREIDMRFLNALNHKYMPYCSGVALGLDRIIMMVCNVSEINNILSFSTQDC